MKVKLAPSTVPDLLLQRHAPSTSHGTTLTYGTSWFGHRNASADSDTDETPNIQMHSKIDSKPVITAHGAGEWYEKSTVLSMFFACHIPRKIPATESEKVNKTKLWWLRCMLVLLVTFYHWLNRAHKLATDQWTTRFTFLSHYAWTQSHNCLQDLDWIFCNQL